MGQLSISCGREFSVFQIFAESKSFRAALKKIEAYDKEHQTGKIAATPEDKKALRESFSMFKEAEKTISNNGTALDYDNPQIIERLNTILTQRLPAISQDVIKKETSSLAIKKANIGMMMAKHAENIRRLGKKMVMQKPERRREQAMTERTGKTGHSPHEKVFSTKTSYKSNHDVIVERLMQERRAQGK